MQNLAKVWEKSLGRLAKKTSVMLHTPTHLPPSKQFGLQWRYAIRRREINHATTQTDRLGAASSRSSGFGQPDHSGGRHIFYQWTSRLLEPPLHAARLLL